MTIAHKNIPEDGLHEPKGVSTAAASRVYKSNGAGSGGWDQVDADTLKGVFNNSSVAGRVLTSDGTGGVGTTIAPAASFGTMNLTNNATSKSVTAAADATLNDDNDFVELDLALQFANVENMVTGGNFLETTVEGVYQIDFWAGVSSNLNATKFSLKFVINGVTFVARGPKLTLGTSGQIYNMSANGIHQFSANDQVKLYIAADKTADITIEDMTFSMVILREPV